MSIIPPSNSLTQTVTTLPSDPVTPSFIQLSKPTVGSEIRHLDRLKDLEARFNAKLIGQEQAVDGVCSALRQIITGFHDENVPYSVLLFAGPTGVGKTVLAKMVAEELAVPFTRYDMSEYSEEHSRSSFLGSPPGYRDSGKGNLIKALQEHQVSVVLFDEIEKAHPNIFPIFLQLFDEGRLTDRMGNSVSAKNTIFIMTTNLGSHDIQKQMLSSSSIPITKILEPLFIKTFSPELYNRFHKTIIFNSLTYKSIVQIAENFMNSQVEDIYRRKQIAVKFDSEVTTHILGPIIDLTMGARGIQRRVGQVMLSILSNGYAARDFSDGDIIRLYKDGKNIKVAVISKAKKKLPALLEPAEPIPTASKAAPIKGVMHIDASGLPANLFIGQLAIRIAPCQEGNRSWMSESVKIVMITHDGSIICESRFTIGSTRMDPTRHRLDAKYNDDKWMLATPALDARAFFINICNKLPPTQARDCLHIIKELFDSYDSLGSAAKHLQNSDPYADLEEIAKQNRNSGVLLEKIKVLKACTGPITVKITGTTPGLTPKKTPKTTGQLHSSAHYDFHLSLPSKL